MNTNNNSTTENAVHDKSSKDNKEEENITCPHGYETCDENDFETMCDECKRERGEAHDEAMHDTYD